MARDVPASHRRGSRSAALLSVLLAMLGVPACGGKIGGMVEDFETGEPIAGAMVTAVEHGWGISSGQLVWDKDQSTSVTTDPDGGFAVGFRHGSSVKLRAQAAGYQRFEAHYDEKVRPVMRLKRRIAAERRLPTGFLRLGSFTDGGAYGWDFASEDVAASPAEADIFPVSIDSDPRGRIRFAAPGGVRFVSKEELGVDALFLIYTDHAPVDGYAPTAVIDFDSEGGVFFVRTRDGARYAKFAFFPSGFFQTSAPGVQRDLTLQYVYNPDGSRNLLYQNPE